MAVLSAVCRVKVRVPVPAVGGVRCRWKMPASSGASAVAVTLLPPTESVAVSEPDFSGLKSARRVTWVMSSL